MAERINKDELTRRIAKRMNTDEKTAGVWLETTLDTMYDVFKGGKGITLTGFGSFYLDRRRDGTAFKSYGRCLVGLIPTKDKDPNNSSLMQI